VVFLGQLGILGDLIVVLGCLISESLCLVQELAQLIVLLQLLFPALELSMQGCNLVHQLLLLIRGQDLGLLPELQVIYLPTQIPDGALSGEVVLLPDIVYSCIELVCLLVVLIPELLGLGNILVVLIPQLLQLLGLVDQLFGGLVELIAFGGPFARLGIQLAAPVLKGKGLLSEFASLIFQFCQHPPFVLLFQPSAGVWPRFGAKKPGNPSPGWRSASLLHYTCGVFTCSIRAPRINVCRDIIIDWILFSALKAAFQCSGYDQKTAFSCDLEKPACQCISRKPLRIKLLVRLHLPGSTLRGHLMN